MSIFASGKTSLLDRAMAVIASVALAITLVALGFAACAAFDTPTQMLSQAFSKYSDSPYSQEELGLAALATKHYTINDNDRYELYVTMEAIAQSAEADGRSLPESINLYEIYLQTDLDEEESSLELEAYVLTGDALSHLDDVYNVIQKLKPFLYAAATAAYIGCVALAFRCGRRALGRVLASAGLGVLLIFLLLALWVALDFDGFFAAFHSLFFAAGTWTFSQDSLLICMYPPQFWLGMGVIWLTVTLAACLICLIIARSLRKGQSVAGQ